MSRIGGSVLLSIRAAAGAKPKVAAALLAVGIYLVPISLLALLYGARPEGPRVLPAADRVPRVLSDADTGLYRQVFALQELGEFRAAKRLVARIEDKLLMGHVLAQRYQRTARPRYDDLRRWLLRYRDHPDAKRIYRLARKLQPRMARWPLRPEVKRNSLTSAAPAPPPYTSKKNLTRKQRRRVSRLKRTIRIWLRRGYITKTERLLDGREVGRLFDPFEIDEARAKVAEGWFYQGHDLKAYRYAAMAIARSGDKLPMANWTAGLASWRRGRIADAARHFEALASVPDLSGWVAAGAALWTARAYTKLGREDDARRWREQAARFPYTLYGVLALTALGRELPFEKRRRPFTRPMAELLASTEEGRRALALIEIGELQRAEQELLGLEDWNRPGVPEALQALADHAWLPSIALKLSKRLAEIGKAGRADEPLHTTLYPIPPWKADEKSGIDQALLFAFMRQESDFNTHARSPVGARGLMQIMPGTARFLNRGRRFRGAKRLDWFDPEVNVDLGQRYLDYLRTHKLVRGDLLRLIAAYNSGPGNIAYWAREKIKDDDDPLLFIESVPSLETRLFVRRVLTNLWIYRHRLGQRAPSLEATAAGRSPVYTPIDGEDAPNLAEEAPAFRDG